jgi:hypothetical protein
MRSLTSRIAALVAVATRPVHFGSGNNNYSAWRGGEGFAPAKPRAAKHMRKGTYNTSEDRKARRRRDFVADQQARVVPKHELRRVRQAAERAS